MVYTFPNMPFVPESHNDDEELRAQSDGQFGVVDCFHWPQLYCQEYQFAVCIRRSDQHPSPDPLRKLNWDKAVGIASLHSIVNAHYTDWKKTRGDKKDMAGRILKAIDHDLMAIFNHPLAFHDIVIFMAQLQRYFLDIMAFLNYALDVLPHVGYSPSVPHPVRSEWMGCFTTDTRVCDELFHVGVLVWLVQKARRWSTSPVVDSGMWKMVDRAFRKVQYRTGAKRCIQNAKYKLFIVWELLRTV